MITPNTDSTFTQVKSNNSVNITWQNGPVTEVVEMTTEHTVEKSIVLVSTPHEDKACEKTGKLDDLLVRAVDETINQIFKEAGAKVIYDCLENKYHLRLEEIAGKPDEFSAGLERLMVSAAPVIEKMILKNLYSKLELKFEEKEGYQFSDYIKELRVKSRC
jgi:acetolactate synthase small subunit